MARSNDKNLIKQAYILIVVSALFLIASMVLTGINNSKISKYEKEYVRTEATITGFGTGHYIESGTNKRRTTYYFVFTYTFNGSEYKGQDGGGYPSVYKKMIGKVVEIYVDPQSPTTSLLISNSDTYSLISILFQSFFMILFAVGGIILINQHGRGFAPRLCFVWLPLFIVSAAVAASFMCLPYANVGEAFAHVRALTAYTVFAGAALIACLIDGLVALKNKRKK